MVGSLPQKPAYKSVVVSGTCVLVVVVELDVELDVDEVRRFFVVVVVVAVVIVVVVVVVMKLSAQHRTVAAIEPPAQTVGNSSAHKLLPAATY